MHLKRLILVIGDRQVIVCEMQGQKISTIALWIRERANEYLQRCLICKGDLAGAKLRSEARGQSG